MNRGPESQPEDTDLGDAIQLDTAETLIGDPNSDPLDAGYIPPDRPFAVDRWGTTAEEMREGEPLDMRLAAEEPEDFPVDPFGRRIDADRAGRLVEDDEGAHEDRTAEMAATDVGIDGGAASAEEAAVHVYDEADVDLNSIDGPPADR
jgi:hypothetical protein